ncbi:VOC family protein [Undibacterium sp. Tian12W]|uniref:VOC family protein n=1 Tax=Undibacterium sp. Tian12W TaxID=3413054 RepID=UPI003BF2901D
MISHVFTGIQDFEKSFSFYSALMTELGLVLKFKDAGKPWAGWMPADQPRPLFVIGKPYNGESAEQGNGQMVALLATSRAVVQHAHALALAHGGTCEGAPGLRPHYHPNYYGAYFRDPDGNKLCVCCHHPED